MGENISNKTQELPASAYLDTNEAETKIYRSAWGLWMMTLTSRVMGVVRDVLMARFLFGWMLDAFVLGITVQNLFRRFLGEGTLAPVLVPRVVERLKSANRVGANRLIRTVLTRIVLYTGVLSALVAVGFLITSLFLGGPAADKFRFMAWFFPYGPLMTAAGVLAAGLNAYGYFSLPALGPVLFNLVIIGSVVFYALGTGGWVVAAAASIGGALSILVMLPAAGREGMALKPAYKDETGSTSEVLVNLVPVALSVAVLQVNVLFDRAAADILIGREGAVGVLYLSHRLVHLPLALFGINMATVFLPRLSSVLHEEGMNEALRGLMSGLRMVLFLSIPAAMGLAVVARPVAVFLFWGGEFAVDEEALTRVVYAVVMYSPGIVFYSVAILIARMYHAQKDVKTPAKYAAYAAGTNIVLDVVLVLVFEKYLGRGEAGLALASSISGLFFAAMLLAGLVPRAGFKVAIFGLASSCTAGVVTFAIMRFRAIQALVDLLQGLFGETGPAEISAYPLDVLSMAAAMGTGAIVLLIVLEGYITPGSGRKAWESAIRIVAAAWPMAAFAYLVVRSIPPSRTGIIIPAERALAPVLLGIFAYWMLIGFTGVREYDELLAALRSRRE